MNPPHAVGQPLKWLRKNAPDVYARRLAQLAQRPVTQTEYGLMDELTSYTGERLPPEDSPCIDPRRETQCVHVERLLERGYVAVYRDERFALPAVRVYLTDEGYEVYSVWLAQRLLEQG